MKKNMKENIKKIARKRIKILFESAKAEFDRHPKRSHRYVKLAKKIAMKANIRLPKKYNKKTCKKCGNYLVPGKNCKIRISSKGSRIVYTCLDCGKIMRFPYKRKV